MRHMTVEEVQNYLKTNKTIIIPYALWMSISAMRNSPPCGLPKNSDASPRRF